jgi:hypothetical protein
MAILLRRICLKLNDIILGGSCLSSLGANLVSLNIAV